MIPVFLDSAHKHKNLAHTYKNWLPDAVTFAIFVVIQVLQVPFDISSCASIIIHHQCMYPSSCAH
jgi:hypothetical protein